MLRFASFTVISRSIGIFGGDHTSIFFFGLRAEHVHLNVVLVSGISVEFSGLLNVLEDGLGLLALRFLIRPLRSSRLGWGRCNCLFRAEN